MIKHQRSTTILVYIKLINILLGLGVFILFNLFLDIIIRHDVAWFNFNFYILYILGACAPGESIFLLYELTPQIKPRRVYGNEAAKSEIKLVSTAGVPYNIDYVHHKRSYGEKSLLTNKSSFYSKGN